MNLKNLFQRDTRPPGDPFAREADEGCCGQHQFCQKELLLQVTGQSIEYYDDEELDVFKNRASDCYSEEETGQFAEVLHTMLPADVPGWIVSLQLREIELPGALREEVTWILDELK
ncbi:hypothetical protein FACS189413_02040 [Bacteroidia bacterium]|nr:hypothetical protein FACS189413_02040 [Bacteroidia bacterium]